MRLLAWIPMMPKALCLGTLPQRGMVLPLKILTFLRVESREEAGERMGQ